MAGVFATQQPEMEDVIMQDASLLSPDNSQLEMDSYGYSPMDISPMPITNPSTNPPAPRRPFVPLAPIVRGPLIRPLQRFSPNSRPRMTTVGLHNHLNPWAKPTIKTSLPSTRDSSFTSFHTNSSTFDRKSSSFGSHTSVATADTIPRKRSIDEGLQDDGLQGDLQNKSIETDSRLPTKYRCVSTVGFPESAILPDPPKPTPEEPVIVTPVNAPQPPTQTPSNAMATASSTTLPPTTSSHIPGMWPEQSPVSSNGPPRMGLGEMLARTAIASNGNTADANQSSYPFTRWFSNGWKLITGLAGSVRRHTAGLFQRRRRTPHGSPPGSPRVNLRALPEEQRRAIRSHQWRRDRGYPTNIDHYPFPDLNIEVPPIPTPATQTSPPPAPPAAPPPSSSLRPSKGSVTIDQNNRISKSRSSQRSPNLDSGLRSSITRRDPTPSIIRPVRPTKAPLVSPKVSPNIKRRMGLVDRRNPEMARKAIMLQQALHTSKFDPAMLRTSYASITKKPEGTTAPSEAPKETAMTPQPLSHGAKKKVHFESPVCQIIPERELVTEIAPFLHPSSPNIPRAGPEEEPSEKPTEKENVPPSAETVPAVEVEAPSDDEEESWLAPELMLGRAVSAVSMFYPEPKPLPPGRTESIYAAEWRKIQEKTKEEQRATRIRPDGPPVRPLPPKWAARVSEAMALPGNRKVATTLAGDPLTKKDLATCHTPMQWLNDEVINAYLALIIDYLRRTHGNAGRHDKPRFHAFNSFFFSNLRDKGYASVRRWANRAKIGGASLLNVDMVLVPVHNSSHWTLIVVKPVERTIEHFDSLGSLSKRHVGLIKEWLRNELGEQYVEAEWEVLPSVSPQQNNGSDCGAFLLSTAKSVAIGIEPLSYGPRDIPLLRRKIVAELMAGGLEGEFDPVRDGEVLL